MTLKRLISQGTKVPLPRPKPVPLGQSRLGQQVLLFAPFGTAAHPSQPHPDPPSVRAARAAPLPTGTLEGPAAVPPSPAPASRRPHLHSPGLGPWQRNASTARQSPATPSHPSSHGGR